ncbi:hypothetical protein COOONC_03322 [Cooperia oncophora]
MLDRCYYKAVNCETQHDHHPAISTSLRVAPLNYIAVPTESFCANKSMVVVIHVKSDDVLTRNTLRRTYGDKRLVEKFSYSLLFSVGRAGGPEEQELLREEARLNGDILQTDVVDAYRKLTYKVSAETMQLCMVSAETAMQLRRSIESFTFSI